MKLASALSERADIQRRMQELAARLNHNAKVQDGELPAENPLELLAELNGLLERYEELLTRINITNTETEVDGVSLTALLAKRDALRQRLSIMRSFLDESSVKVQRYARTEIKIQSTVDVAKLQKQVDKLAMEFRQVDEKIQAANWTTELL